LAELAEIFETACGCGQLVLVAVVGARSGQSRLTVSSMVSEEHPSAAHSECVTNCRKMDSSALRMVGRQCDTLGQKLSGFVWFGQNMLKAVVPCALLCDEAD